MKNLTATITAAEVRAMNLKDADMLSFDHLNGFHILKVNGIAALSFVNASDRAKSKAKIQRMGLATATPEKGFNEEETGALTGEGSYVTVLSR